MSILPKSWQGFGAAMGEISPMLLSMGAAMQNGKSPFLGAQAGLAQMMQQDATEEDKRRWEAEMELRRGAFELQKQAAARAAANAGRSAGASGLRQAADLAALGALFGDSGPVASGPLSSALDAAPMGLDMGASGPAAPMGLDMGASLDMPPQSPLASAMAQDTMVGGQGQDTLLGGDGADMLAAPSGPASLFGNFQPNGVFDFSPMGQKLQGVYGKQMYAPRQQPQPQAQPGQLSPERRQQLMQIVSNPRVSEPLRNRAMQMLMPEQKEPKWTRFEAGDGSVWLYDENKPENRMQLSGPAAPERKIVTGADGYQYYTDGTRVLPGVNKPPEQATYNYQNAPDGSLLALNPKDPTDARTVAPAVAPVPNFRPATEEEAAKYGAKAGQIDTKTGRFYPGQQNGQGFMMTLPDGTQVAQGDLAGVKFTEGQAKDNVYATRARGALEILEPVSSSLTSRGDRIKENVPFGLARGMQKDSFQVAKQAGDEFLQAILRKDTGAAITEPEQVLYGVTYLPQPGDGEAVLEAKRQARYRAINAIEAGMSPLQQLVVDQAQVQSAAEAEATAPEGAPTLQRSTPTTPPAAEPAASEKLARKVTDRANPFFGQTLGDLLKVDTMSLTFDQLKARNDAMEALINGR